MRRRALLRTGLSVATVGTAATAGCLAVPRLTDYSLWFLRIHNGTLGVVGVEIEVDRDGESLFETRFAAIPSFRATEEQEASFADMDSARLIGDEWEPRPGQYTVTYRLSTDETTHQFRVSNVESFDADHVGVDLQLLGRGDAVSASPNVLTFDSRRQVTEFLETVTTSTGEAASLSTE
jgi:hypothetical protein